MAQDLSQLAQSRRHHQVFSTLFPAESVQKLINTDSGIDDAIAWCRSTAVTKVYVESYRSAVLADEDNLVRARDRFREAGLAVSGCVTTTRMLLPPDSRKEWQYFPCFTHPPAQEQLQRIFEFTAGLFDEIMIDDFFCTYCECAACQAGRGDRSWEDYRRELMMQVSRERVLAPARGVNPNVKIIIKYPQWYEAFPTRAYIVDSQTEIFDRIWVGTESRDMDEPKAGLCATYRPFWIMRWLGRIGGDKCGGGWYDPYDTHQDSYLEQARQTILGGARESLLFCYPSLLDRTGPANIEALRKELPALFDLAAWVKDEAPRGIVSYMPVGASGDGENYIFDWLGMIGLPIIPDHRFPDRAEVAFFSSQAACDPGFAAKAQAFLAAGRPAILTESAAKAAGVTADHPHAFIFHPPSTTRDIMDLPADRISALREAALRPLGLHLEAPPRVSLYLLGDGKLAVESFRNEPAEVRISFQQAGDWSQVLALGGEGAHASTRADRASAEGATLSLLIPPRSLLALERR